MKSRFIDMGEEQKGLIRPIDTATELLRGVDKVYGRNKMYNHRGAYDGHQVYDTNTSTMYQWDMSDGTWFPLYSAAMEKPEPKFVDPLEYKKDSEDKIKEKLDAFDQILNNEDHQT